HIAFVETVAITLGIPERGQPKGDQAFAQWQAQRAQPAADSEATARSEAQANVSTPSDTAPEAVTPTAATNPARANDPDLQSPSELVRLEAQWRRDFPMSEADVRASDTVMALRGEDHAIWIIATDDKTPEAAAMLASY
ncbi:Relaxase, partial [Pseudomonas coronafaciens pv. porri]